TLLAEWPGEYIGAIRGLCVAWDGQPACAHTQFVSVPRRLLRSSTSARNVADSRARGAAGRARPVRGRGMPETIRATGGSLKARLRALRFQSPAVAGALPLLPTAAVAQDTAGWPWPLNSPYVVAVARLEQHEVAALALIVGVICFAVVTSIMLVRTRMRSVVD